MASIREIAQRALETGYLSLAEEDQLRQLLQQTQYGWDDLDAFISLQQAAMTGYIRQESREIKKPREYEYSPASTFCEDWSQLIQIPIPATALSGQSCDASRRSH